MASSSSFPLVERSSTGNRDRKSVLIIDNTLKDREYYADRLVPEYFLYMADRGKTGLECFYAHRIDCVVLELDLPDVSGFEVLIELVPVASRPAVPVIILTRLPNRMITELAVKNGAQAGLHKSETTPDQLSEAVFKAIVAVPRDYKKESEAFKFPRTKTETLITENPAERSSSRVLGDSSSEHQ
ncbi:hypothetical protein W02_31000 [Nitrospira sp. KM1]|uniref:response regulator n=1 Tax=Nitrospira sp. KM1 TaxID=1936990 RepID=UPI0013A729D8|nr:response regulator [Nitrospira sp. KM1]BCA55960.1 hypothetical protein W02_31000 [Nitrospira sp. KM1]